MNPYYCNDAVLQITNVHSVVDLTRQCLEIVTAEGAALTFVIERTRLAAGVGLGAAVEASVAERRRSHRGFELASITPREYPEVSGSEVRLTILDKDRGLLFFHELHFELDGTHVKYACSSPLAQAGACDHFMQATLSTLRLR